MRRFSLLFFLFVSLSAFSQMAYQQYDASSGFPTNQFYEVFEDSRGYIWALSDNGIYRFNGEEFEKIEIEASLGTSIPIDVIEDKRGLFVLFLDGLIGCYAYPESLIKAHHLNDEIQQNINGERKAYREQNAVNNSFRSVGDTVLVFSSYGDGIISIGSNEIVRHDFDQRVRVGVHGCFGKNQVLSLDGKELRKRAENDLFNFNGVIYNVKEIAGVKMSTGANVFVLDRKENMFVSVGTGLMRFKMDNLFQMKNLVDL